jgi:hypothetical protein
MRNAVGLERGKHWSSGSNLGDRGYFLIWPSSFLPCMSVSAQLSIINSRFLGQLAMCSDRLTFFYLQWPERPEKPERQKKLELPKMAVVVAAPIY